MLPRTALPLSRQKPLIIVLCLNVFCSVLNGTMFNIAIPDIASQFRLSPGQVSWVISGYVMLFACGALAFGKLADLYPVRRLVTIGLLLFNAGALIGLTADSYTQLLIGRLVQACGGASIPALAMLTATRYVPAGQRGRVLGAIASTVALGSGTGPILGGALAGLWHWRYLFLVSFLTLLILPVYRLLLPADKPVGRSFDLPGGLLLVIAISGLMLLIVTGWWPGAILVGLSSLLLTLHLRRAPWPFIPWRLLGNRTYQLALATTFLAVGTVFGMFFVVPLMLRELFSLSTIEIGLTIFPAAFCAALMGFRAGTLADRVGSNRVVHYGLVAMLSGYALLTLSPLTSALVTALFLIPVYNGFAFIHAALAKIVSLTLPAEESGVGMGLYNLVFFLSGAFGIALASRMLELLSGQTVGGFSPDNPEFPYSCIFLLSLATVLIARWLFRHLPNNQPD